MADYISREAVLACFSDWIDRYGHEHTADEMVEYQRIEDLPAADVVSRDCYDRILAENDTMREMLARIGKKPGDSMDDVRPVVRCKDCIHAPLPGDCEGGSNMEWPKIDGIYEDYTCPYFCDDDWYSTRPDPDRFCEKGERRESNLDTTKGDSHD